jgi:hypothetical protein
MSSQTLGLGEVEMLPASRYLLLAKAAGTFEEYMKNISVLSYSAMLTFEL